VAKIKAYAILPSIAASPDKVVKSWMTLRQTHTPTIYLHSPDAQVPRGPDAVPISCKCDTLGMMLSTVLEKVTADLFIWIPPGVEVNPDGLDKFINAYKDNPESTLFVSDYTIDGHVEEIHPFRNDLTEREDFGAVWGIPSSSLAKIGGPNLNLKHATFYDMRLKLAEIGDITHIPEATHTVTPPADESSEKSEALFFPGRGSYGGFSYLFMDPEEEKEIETVIYECLRRRGAFLEPRDNVVPEIELSENDPIVSVVIPVHNRDKFLPLAINSVLKNTLQDFEIIIIDNASTDGSRAVAEEFAANDSRIRSISSDVNLIARALNMGVHAARGRYIAQLDSDDEYITRTLEKMVEHLENHPNCGLAISYYELMDEKGSILEEFGVIEHLEYNINNIMRVDGAGAVRVWRKNAILEFGGFNETDFPNYGEDYDLVLKVGEKYDVDRVHASLYRYRRHPGNTDALRNPIDKIRAKTLARTWAIDRRKTLNGNN
jgi:Glycosyl transferase family 2